MSKNYTPEKREEIQRRITELVRKHGRMTLTGLRKMTGLTMYSTRRYLDKAERCGDVYQAGRGGGDFPVRRGLSRLEETGESRRWPDLEAA